MIQAVIYETASGDLCGFKVSEHGGGIVCAAMSMLTINTINSLEALTGAGLEYCYDDKGGYAEVLLPGILEGKSEPEAALLLKSFVLGLKSIQETYGSGKDGVRARCVKVQKDAVMLIKGNYTNFKR